MILLRLSREVVESLANGDIPSQELRRALGAALVVKTEPTLIFDLTDLNGVRILDIDAELDDEEEDEVDVSADGSEPEPRNDWPKQAPFGTPPFGWQRNGDRLIKNKAEQSVLRAAVSGRNRGWSFSQIAADLNGRSLRTRRGSKWDSSGVGRLFKRSLNHELNKPHKNRLKVRDGDERASGQRW